MSRDQRRLSLSVDAEATRETALTLFFLLAAFVVAVNFLAGRKRLWRLANFLVIFGLALAVFALIQHFTWNGRLFWLRATTQSAMPFGPFVNHNHFAGYLEMILPLAAVLAMIRGLRGEARLFYGFAAALMGTAIVASLSRGGMISLAASLLFISLFSVRSNKSPAENVTGKNYDLRPDQALSDSYAYTPPIRRTILPRLFVRFTGVALLLLAIIAGTVWLGGGAVVARLTNTYVDSGQSKSETFYSSRGWVWKNTWAMVVANPITGVGLGAFQTAYPRYSHSDGSVIVSQAHNDYLQILAEGGAVGGAIALWFIVLVVRAVWRGRRSRDAFFSSLAVGGGASITAILVHSLFDFNLQLPSHALLFLVISAAVSNVASLAAESGRAEILSQLPVIGVRRQVSGVSTVWRSID